MLITILTIACFLGLSVVVLYVLQHRLQAHHVEQIKQFAAFKEQLQKDWHEQRTRFDERQMNTLTVLQDTMGKNNTLTQQSLKEALKDSAQQLSTNMDQLTKLTKERLEKMSAQVEERLSVSFEKTNATFTDIVKRLALIDEAQKKITELSGHVMSLQDVLVDKRSRGAFGEVQLESLVRNVIPEQHVKFQHTLSNQRRADCFLILPPPTGNMVIDAKFPLENYQRLMDSSVGDADRQQAKLSFKQDVKKHIQDIADKYIIPGETADGAIMFIPSEAIFAEVHANFIEIVEYSHKRKVWLVSPTTMVAILTTASAVLKDDATRKQVHVIQEHLGNLAVDFGRFQKRMDGLAKHIDQAHRDVQDVNKSAKKITSRFDKIEKVELAGISDANSEDKEAKLLLDVS